MDKLFTLVEMKLAKLCNINDSFEELSFIYSSPTLYTAIAATECTFLTLDSKNLEELLLKVR